MAEVRVHAKITEQLLRQINLRALFSSFNKLQTYFTRPFCFTMNVHLSSHRIMAGLNPEVMGSNHDMSIDVLLRFCVLTARRQTS